MSVQLLRQFPSITCDFETREEFGVSWLEVHHDADASSPVGSVEFPPRLCQLIVSVLLVGYASLHPVCGRDLRLGSRETTPTNVQSRHTTTRGSDQMKRKGDCQKGICHDSHSDYLTQRHCCGQHRGGRGLGAIFDSFDSEAGEPKLTSP